MWWEKRGKEIERIERARARGACITRRAPSLVPDAMRDPILLTRVTDFGPTTTDGPRSPGVQGGELVSKRRTPLSEFNWDYPSNGIREWVHIGIQQKGSNKYGHCSKETSLPLCQ
ncbi:hypothetical protein CDAR_491951 [Caerostris darwini]|uniref:Uncharacterized protein n=1 Tax=Caerostris darwini TaxID=1538125 RepID=A0AAV4VJG3_9ARAC|nr:hypothetical protein CDAR_491951 [Caerostris darwini]